MADYSFATRCSSRRRSWRRHCRSARLIAAANFGLGLLHDDRAEQRECLEDFRYFCEFSAQDYCDELMHRWLDYRGKRGKQ